MIGTHAEASVLLLMKKNLNSLFSAIPASIGDCSVLLFQKTLKFYSFPAIAVYNC